MKAGQLPAGYVHSCGSAHHLAVLIEAGRTAPTHDQAPPSVGLQLSPAQIRLVSAAQVEVCGRAINVGRPRGYVEPPAGAVASNMGAAQMFAASLVNQPTRCLLLENMLKAQQVLEDEERGEVCPP